MIMINSEATTKSLLEIMVASSHSRFPIHNEDQDTILGVILAKDLLAHLTHHQDDEFNYREYLRDALSVPESKPLGSLLREFQQNKSHMAIVLDEYGEIAGLVTLEDVIEQIVGEIEDEHDKEEDNIIDYGDGRYLLQANTTLNEFNEFFDSNIRSDDYDTVAGLVISGFSYLPEQMSETELSTTIQAIIERLGASSMKDMGKVMGVATKELAGKADGKLVSQIVKAALS